MRISFLLIMEEKLKVVFSLNTNYTLSFEQIEQNPAEIYLLIVSNGGSRLCVKRHHWHRSGVFIFNFEQI